ncbi:cytochrome c oxidase subunit IV family [Zopfochytrium polystomum]|nr:cytochrome c oxidase subunit IV family [Zopfochytrium polystomum]
MANVIALLVRWGVLSRGLFSSMPRPRWQELEVEAAETSANSNDAKLSYFSVYCPFSMSSGGNSSGLWSYHVKVDFCVFFIEKMMMMRARLAAAAARGVRQASSTAAAPFTPLTAIETRWGKLPEAEQGAIADLVAAAEKGDWKKMTLEQKRAAYFIAYGPYGARNPIDPALKWSVLAWVSAFFGISYIGYKWWDTQKPVVKTMSPEWKAAEVQKAIEARQNPYKGPINGVYTKPE